MDEVNSRWGGVRGGFRVNRRILGFFLYILYLVYGLVL